MNETNEFSFILKPSTVEGVGVFALHDIDAGTKLNLIPDNYEFRMLKKKNIPTDLIKYCISEGDFYHCPKFFNSMYISNYLNHSSQPNAQWDEAKNNYYALVPIKKGEEIFIDYACFNEPDEAKEGFWHGSK